MIRIILPAREYRESLKDLDYNGIVYTTSWYSTASATIPKWKVKIVDASATRQWEGVDVLPGEAARIALSDLTSEFKVYPGTAPIPAPHYHVGEWQNYAWYIDVKSCFAEIYSRLDTMSYFDGQKLWHGGGESLRPARERLQDFKSARNAIPGLLNSTLISLHKDGKEKKVKNPSKYFNPNIVNFCHYVCHRLARHALDNCALLYWNTDGGFTAGDPGPIVELAYKFGLDCRVHKGELDLRSWAAYSFISEGYTKNIGTAPRQFSRKFIINNIARFL